MPKRKKYQSADFVAGAYKKIALNKEGFNERQLLQMRMAADRLALMDEIFKVEQLVEPVSAVSTEDTLLASLRAKHGVSGGTNAITENS
jgi:hypothetical protein